MRGVQGDLHLVVGVLQPHHVVIVPGAVQVQLVLEQTGSYNDVTFKGNMRQYSYYKK